MGPETVDRIIALLKEVDEKVEALRSKIDGILDWVPWGLGWAVDKFMELWDWAMGKLDEFFTKMGEILSNVGAPWDLNDAKDDWGDIGGPVAARASEATKGQSDVDFAWSGRAANRYAEALGEQQNALKSVRDKLTALVGPALGDVATALYTFFLAIIAAIGIMIIGIVTATGEAVSILGLPAVPPTVFAAIAAALASIAIGTNELLGSARSAETIFSSLADETSDFGANNWPKAVI